MLKGKSVLLLVPSFYGYEYEIKRKLISYGADVLCINDDPKEWYGTIMSCMELAKVPRSFWIGIFERNVYKKIERYKFDYVIVICGWAITSNITSRIRKFNLQEGGRMVLYYWDSLKRLKDDTRRWSDFDEIYTFDKEDYLSNKGVMRFLPLFYCDHYWQEEMKAASSDLKLIGSFRLNRLEFIRKLRENNPTINIDTYLFTKKWVIVFHKLFRKKYDSVKYTDLKFVVLSSQEVVEEYKDCNAVLDIPANGQSGLAIRTLETLAMHKKLVTTNPDIETYDFFDAHDIFVVSNENMSLPDKEWFNSPFSISDDIIKKYSIDSWLKKLLFDGRS